MQTTILKKDFINALTIGGAMSGQNKILPILENAKVEVTADTLSVHSFDGENYITNRVGILETNENYSFCVNANELVKILKTFSDEFITFTIKDSKINFKHSKGKFSMPILNGNDFVDLPLSENNISFIVSAKKIKEWVTIASNFVSTDALRPIMNGMYIYAKDNRLGVCATDAHKLYADSIEYIYDGTLSAVIPYRGFRPLLSILKNIDEITVSIGQKNIIFITDSSILICRIIEGVYPNFERVIPNETLCSTKVNKNELIEVLNRSSLLTDKLTGALKLSFIGKDMLIEGCDLVSSLNSYDTIEVDKNGDDMTIGVKSNLLHNCVSSINSDIIEILSVSENRPLILREIGSPNKIVLVMPMKID